MRQRVRIGCQIIRGDGGPARRGDGETDLPLTVAGRQHAAIFAGQRVVSSRSWMSLNSPEPHRSATWRLPDQPAATQRPRQCSHARTNQVEYGEIGKAGGGLMTLPASAFVQSLSLDFEHRQHRRFWLGEAAHIEESCSSPAFRLSLRTSSTTAAP